MTQNTEKPRNDAVRAFIGSLILVGGIVIVSVLATGGGWERMGSMVQGMSLHAPDFGLIAQRPLPLQIHLYAAVAAFVVGLYQLIGPKGKTPHRLLGWLWVVLILITAISSFFLTGLNGDAYSFIHLLSGWTVVVAPMLVYAARTHNIKRHRNIAMGLFMGGLVVAGLFAFIPGRLLWQVFFG